MDEIKSASSQQARGIIRSCLGKEDQKYPFIKVTMVKELWDKLEAKYMECGK